MGRVKTLVTFRLRVGIPFWEEGYFWKSETSSDTPIEGGHTSWGGGYFGKSEISSDATIEEGHTFLGEEGILGRVRPLVTPYLRMGIHFGEEGILRRVRPPVTLPLRVGIPFWGGGYLGKSETSSDIPIDCGPSRNCWCSMSLDKTIEL